MPEFYTKYPTESKVDYRKLSTLALERKKAYDPETQLLPKRIIFSKKWFFEEFKTTLNPAQAKQQIILYGSPAGAITSITGTAAWVRGKEDLKKSFSNKIIVTKK